MLEVVLTLLFFIQEQKNEMTEAHSKYLNKCPTREPNYTKHVGVMTAVISVYEDTEVVQEIVLLVPRSDIINSY
jgi:hypothetical protein